MGSMADQMWQEKILANLKMLKQKLSKTKPRKKTYFTNHIKCKWAENPKQKAKIVRSDKNIKTDT